MQEHLNYYDPFSKNDKQPIGPSQQGVQSPFDPKNDRFKVKELADGLKQLSENIELVDAKSLRELEEAIGKFNKSKGKIFPVSI